MFASAPPFLFEHTSTPFHKGLEGVSRTFLNYAQTQIEDMVQTVQSLFACRSLDELNAVQERFMQQSFDRLVNEASKIAQTTATLAKDAVVPLNDEMENMAQKMRDFGRSV